jgi:anaerobic magnesium-protoporphyrin IX monomethyl ester cyclase
VRIAFWQASIPRFEYQCSLPPLGIGYLSAYLKQQCWYVETTFFHTVEELIAAKPDIAALSASSENFNLALDAAEKIRAALGIPIVLGGIHITSLPHTLPETCDVGVIGEGEETFTELIKLFYARHPRRPEPTDLTKIRGLCYHEDGAVRVNELRDLIAKMDILPYPDREILGHKWKMPFSRQVHMITSRGCPYSCNFCSSSLQWRRYRFFSPEYVVREVEFLRRRYDPEEIFFFDDLFIGNRARFEAICSLLRERQLHTGVVFRCYGRVDLMNDEIADLMRAMNFRYVDFGFESHSARILKYMNKQNVTPELNQRAIDLLASRGTSIGANIIIGFPPETMDDMMQSYQFIERNKDHLDRISMGPLIPNPGTQIWDYALKRGLVSEDMDWSRLQYNFEDFNFERYPYMCESVSREEFYGFYEKFRNLAKEIIYVGEMRRLIRENAKKEDEIRRLRSHVETIEGSGLFRLAWVLRKWKSAVVGRE